MKSDLNSTNSTGSSPSDEPVFVLIGKFRRPHGIRGEIRMTVLTDFPELISPGQVIYAGERYSAYTVREIRWHGGDILVSLKELPDRTAVEIFRNVMVYMKSEDMPELPEGDYFIHQLVGMEVITDQGEKLGTLKEILITGANDVYLVESPEGKELLIPAIEDVVLDINQDSGQILVHIISGLLDF
ncbi:MAG: 16S rRNA processing protein RimM [Anaerolineales bacterium]|nr:16S rRNA processing protein RimM [Anaerolineales bacterium]